jgi:membrane protease YdiL (CAAX protease family)
MSLDVGSEPAGRELRLAGLDDDRRPTRLGAWLIWLAALVLMLMVSGGVALAAQDAAIASGVKPAQLLKDPMSSPLVKDAGWVALGTLANELSIVAVLVACLVLFRFSKRTVLPFARPRAAQLGGALLLVFGLAPLADLAGELVHRVVGNEVTAARVVGEAARNATPLTLTCMLLCVAVVPGVVEEAMFRGLLTSAFLRGSTAAAVIVPSIMFGVFHLEPTQVAGTIILGMGFALVRLYTRSLGAGMISHAVYNGSVILALRYGGPPAAHRIAPIPLLVGALMAALGVALLRRKSAGPAVD